MSLNITKQLVSDSVAKARTYGGENPVDYITVHQTGNTSKGANAEMHAKLQSRLNPRQASWHYQVDDKEAIQSFEDSAQCWAAGDGRGPGNLRSVHVEICINSDGDYAKSVENGAMLVAHLLDKHGLSSDKVRQHYDWSKKNCPAQLRSNKDGISWDDFIGMVNGKKDGESSVSTVNTPKKPKPNPKSKNKSIAQMVDEVEAGLHGNGHTNRRKSLRISEAEYAKVRTEVNRRAGVKTTPKPKSKSIGQMADEVIANKHGNGHDNRRKSLGISAAEYAKVRAEVNRRAGVAPKKAKKTVSQMATEVIAGKHGNGHANRRKSLGISQTEYEKVRSEVNRRS